MTVESGGPGTPMSERMQSLLSRAVEDQLSEQRQIAGVLGDLRAQLQRVTADVAALRSEPGGGGASDAALASISAEVREAVRLLAERLDGVARLVQQRGADLAELRGSTDQLQASVRGQGEVLGGVSSGLAAIPAFAEQIGGLQDNLTALHERLAGLDHVGAALAALQQRVEGVDQGLRELRSAFAAIGARMAELPGRGDLEAAAQTSAAPFGQLGERLGGMEQSVAALAAQVAALAQRPDDASEGQALRADLAQLAASTREDSSGVHERLAALDDRLTEVLDLLTPAEPVDEAGEDEEEYVDPVVSELAELREALLGEDGLAARVEAAGTDDLDARVSSAVENAVAASEARLSAHIDEAVLALAEALLRRRATRMTPAETPPAETPPAETPPAERPPAEAPAREMLSLEMPPAGVAPAEAVEWHEAAEPEADDDASEGVEADGGSPWQTPTSVSGSGPVAESGSEDADRRRRPWWRPGD